MTRKLKIQFYRDKKHEWRWRIKSGAKVLADSGEGYKRLASAVSGAGGVTRLVILSFDRDVWFGPQSFPATFGSIGRNRIRFSATQYTVEVIR